MNWFNSKMHFYQAISRKAESWGDCKELVTLQTEFQEETRHAQAPKMTKQTLLEHS